MPETPPLWLSLSASAVRVLPFGRYRAANLVSRLGCPPFVSRLPRELGGAAYECDIRDSIAREAFFTGRYEPQETILFRRLVRPGMTVVDVGANWGYFTLVAAHLTGPAGRVVALEPHPGLHATLVRNVAANGYATVECACVAAGPVTARAAFHAHPEDGGNSGLTRVAADGMPFHFTAPVEPLDALMARSGIAVVDLVKIDVEGAEAGVLAGMRDGLAARAYRYLLVELHPSSATGAASIEECVAILAARGYAGWSVDHSPGMHRRCARDAGTSGLLAPLDERWAPGIWPHLLWAAPGVEAPA
jgi:FkbM family methyltransferase